MLIFRNFFHKIRRHVPLLVLSASLIFYFGNTIIYADDTQDRLNSLNAEIEEYEKELSRLTAESNTLSNQIAQYDAQISLSLLKINQTEAKISLLGGRIGQLKASLESLNIAFVSRVGKTYRMSRINDPLLFLVASPNLSKATSSFQYLKRIQEADRDLLTKLSDVHDKYEVEKDELVDLKSDLENQKIALDVQKSAKSRLLIDTKNDERKYQQFIAKAKAELAAIQSIIAGQGTESQVGGVSEGQRIASVIAGPSTCSSGGHLHFEIVKDKAHKNPASFLIPKSIDWDNGPDSPFTFSGNWQWPINDPIRVTQGYGMTHYASVLKYYGGAPHTGVDMINKNDYTVKAVKSGTLYQGAIACGGGTLRYVRVQQSDGYDTYYLHINY